MRTMPSGKEGARTRHIYSVILATLSEPERKRANDSVPQMDIVMQRGISIRRAAPTDMKAGLIITWKEGGLVFSL